MMSTIFIIFTILSKLICSQTSFEFDTTTTPTNSARTCTRDEPLVIDFNETNINGFSITLGDDVYCNWKLNFEELLTGATPNIINIDHSMICGHTLVYVCDTGSILSNITYDHLLTLYTQEPLVCVNYTPQSYSSFQKRIDDENCGYLSLSVVDLSKVDNQVSFNIDMMIGNRNECSAQKIPHGSTAQDFLHIYTPARIFRIFFALIKVA
jgi:hypothetical protein